MAVNTEKRCSKCGETKSLDEFSPLKHKGDRRGLRSRCKACTAVDTARWRSENPGVAQEQMLQWRHGMTLAERDEILDMQQGVCAMPDCDRPATNIDHDHRCCPPHQSCRNCRRAILCNPCNQLVGRVEAVLNGTSPRLAAVVEYLGRFDGDE